MSKLARAPNVRGVYESWDKRNGVWIPHENIFTLKGWEQILKAAFWGEELAWEVGLCNTTPAAELDLEDIGEPDATGGYDRQTLIQAEADWPTVGQVENESFITSKEFTFPHTGPDYSGPVSRLFLTDGEFVLSVSSAFPAPITYDEASTHQYRLYFR